MNEYKRDIAEIKEILKVIQKCIEQLEADHYHFTMPEPVPSTQACKMDR